MDVPLVVGDVATIRDALKAIQEGAGRAAIIVTPTRELVGIVSDGDIRRALIAGADLSDSVEPLICRSPIVASEADSRDVVLDLMKARSVSQVPIVDRSGRFLGLHLLSELVGGRARNNFAVIMAGGRGSRLRPTTDALPKSMLRVAGRPILERLVNHLVGFGIRDIVLSVGYRANDIEDFFGDGSEHGCAIYYIREDPSSPLGSGGPLAMVPRLFPSAKAPLLVLNGDLVTQFDVDAILNHHQETRAAATVATFPYAHTVPFGVLSITGSGDITAIEEKPTRLEAVNAGIYVLSREVLERIPTKTYVPMTAILEDCIGRGDRVSSWSLDQDWLDVGRPEDLARARGHG